MKSLPFFDRLPEARKVAGCGTTKIYEMIGEGEFPKPVKLSEGGRAVAWDRAELIAWHETRLALRDVRLLALPDGSHVEEIEMPPDHKPFGAAWELHETREGNNGPVNVYRRPKVTGRPVARKAKVS